MTPVDYAIHHVTRAIGSFHPGAMPRLARRNYRHELMAWFFLPVMLGAVEGGVVSVIAKNAFIGLVPDRALNVAVAILSGAPAFANITSFLWASISHGRNKIRFLVGLQITVGVLVAQVALAPPNGLGLAMLTIGAVGARICWSGVVTLRSTVWRANYPRDVRAHMAGKLATIQSIMLGATGFTIGLAMRIDEQSFHLLFPIAAAVGLVGASFYRSLRMRGHAAILSAERREAGGRSVLARPLALVRILASDRPFRAYMVTMWLFGIGNMMIAAPLVIMLRDEFGMRYFAGIMIASTIPILLMPLVIPFWSRLLDRMHVVRFRVYHCWTFMAANLCVLLGAVLHVPALLWVSAAFRGIATGGGVLGWNLGHHDFAPPALSSEYMGIHVTLTGLRGLIGPAIAVTLYELLETWRPGAGGWVFAVCLALNVAGAIGFLVLARRIHPALRGER